MDSKEILKHLLIEFRYGNVINGDHSLNESHGYVNGIDNYMNDFLGAVEKKIIPEFEKGKPVSHKIFDGSIFKKTKTFFDDCYIEVKVIRSDELKYGGGYFPRKSMFRTSMFKRKKPYFNMVIGIVLYAYSKEIILKTLRFIFAHELTHAYEDYKRRTNNSSMDDHARRTKYYNTIYYNSNPNRRGQDVLATILNRLNSTERNAIIGQLRSEMMAGEKDISDSKSAWKVMKSTEAWKRYELLEKNIHNLIIIASGNDKYAQTLLKSFNEITENNFTLSKLKNYLTYQWIEWRNKFITMASKIAYDVYCHTVIFDDFSGDNSVYPM